MRAIDTHVVVRYLTGDDAVQAARARAAVDSDDVFVSTTVLLESEWVLRSVYGFGSEDVVAALRAFAGLPTVLVESPVLLAEALERADLGMDFADALHLGAAGHCSALITFDTAFVEAARGESVKVLEP